MKVALHQVRGIRAVDKSFESKQTEVYIVVNVGVHCLDVG